MKISHCSALILIIFIAIYSIKSFSEKTKDPEVTPALKLGFMEKNNQLPTKKNQTNSILYLVSPFGHGRPPDIENAETRAAHRNDKMKKKGYGTPPEYFFMSLTKLRALALKGDVFALLQLGQQYWDEVDALQRDPSYDFTKDPKTLSVQYMTDAVMNGHNRAALVLAERLASDNPIEAYSWVLVAKELGDTQANIQEQIIRSSLNQEQFKQAQFSALHKINDLTKVWTQKIYGSQPAAAARSELPSLPQ